MLNIAEDLRETIDWVRQAFPPGSLVHVGAGRGIGEMHRWREWGVPRAVLIDSQVKPDSSFTSMLGKHAGWSWLSGTLSDADAEADFFVASNPAESGLLDVEKLQPLWPNLRMIEWARVETRRLDSLLLEQAQSLEPDWLIIDCFPSVPILQGAGKLLDDCQVVWVRAVLDNSIGGLVGSTLDDVLNFFASKAFRCAGVARGTHPAVGDVLFIRDWPRYLRDRLKQSQHDVLDSRQGFDQEFNLVKAERDRLLADKTELAGKVEASSRELAELKVAQEKLTNEKILLAEAQQTLAQQKVELDRLSRESADRAQGFERELGLLKAERDELLADKIELNGRVEASSREFAELKAANEKLTAEKIAITEAQQTLAQEKVELERLSQESAGNAEGFDQELSLLRAERDRYSARLNELEMDISASLLTQVKLVDEKNALAEAYERVSSQKAELIVTRDALSKKKNDLVAAREAMMNQIASLQAENAQLSSQLEALQVELDSLLLERSVIPPQIQADNSKSTDDKPHLISEHSRFDQEGIEGALNVELPATGEVDFASVQAEIMELPTADSHEPLESGAAIISMDEYNQQLEALHREKASLTEQLAILARDNASLAAVCDALAREKSDLIVAYSDKFESLEANEAKLTMAAREKLVYQDQGQDLAKEISSIIARLADRETALKEKDIRLNTLESDLIEYQRRQYLMNEEMLKAEAQIDLIKDVLLRDPGF